MNHPEPPDPIDLLMDMDDAEMRARTARQWGLAFDEDGLIDGLSLGDGPEARLNRSAYGDTAQARHRKRVP